MHPRIRRSEAAPGHRRLIGLLLAAPFFLSAIFSALLSPQLGAMTGLAVICATFGAAWSLALLVAASGVTRIAETLALALGAAAASAMVGAAGGAASPVLLLVLALPFEAWWLKRSPEALRWGGLAAALAAIAQEPLGQMLFAGAPAATAWHWIAPLAYAACVAPRVAGLFAAAQSEEAAADPLEEIIDAVVIRMKTNGDVADVSAKARSVLQIAPAMLLFNGLFERVHLADRVSYLSALADMREGAAARRLELRLRIPSAGDEAKADNYRPFVLDFARDPGSPERLVAIVRDNGETAALRAAVAASAEKAASIDIAKSRFLAAVSHELRTPLNAIIGFSDMLIHEMFGGFNDPRQKEYVGLVRESGHHLLAVVNSILDVSRIESGTYATSPELFRFSDAVEMCGSMMRMQAEAKRLDFSIDVPADIGQVHADQRAVQQILINLVSNAIKFTPEGGRVAIGANRVGSRVHFWVSDNGIGIAPDDLPRLGKPFMQIQTDYTRQFEGTGLGLSLVKGLVALHDGAMSIESEAGAGTTVTISLPVDGSRRQAGAADTAEIVAIPAGRPKEDNDGARRKTA